MKKLKGAKWQEDLVEEDEKVINQILKKKISQVCASISGINELKWLFEMKEMDKGEI